MHLLPEVASEHHDNAGREYGHNRQRDHRAAVSIFNERMHLTVAWQQIPKACAGDDDQRRAANDGKHVDSLIRRAPEPFTSSSAVRVVN